MNWEIEKTSETPSKKLEFNIDKPETGLKKTDFNIITNNNDIDDMNDDKMDCHNNNPTNVVYSNINHKYIQQEWTTHNSLYRLGNSEIQLNYDLEESYRTDDWKSTNSHKGELVIVYNNKVGNETLHPIVIYILYIRPNDIDNGHLIYRLSTDQILVTKEYQSVPVSDDLIEGIKETNSHDNKIQVIHLKGNHGLKSPRYLLYKSKNRNKHPLRNTSTLLPISWKFTKKRSHIIRDISIPDHLPCY